VARRFSNIAQATTATNAAVFTALAIPLSEIWELTKNITINRTATTKQAVTMSLKVSPEGLGAEALGVPSIKTSR